MKTARRKGKRPGPAIAIRIDRAGATPAYLQIADRLEAAIRSGAHAPGGRLPTVREIALACGVTLPTVQRAFSELRQRGLTEATVGRGTFVRRGGGAAGEGPAATEVPRGAAQASFDLEDDAARPGMIRMARAEPDDASLPAEAFWDCLTALRPEAAALLRYPSAEGDRPLREILAAMAAKRGIAAGPDEILITSGVSQALSLAVAALARPGEVVAVEEPAYLGVFETLRARGVRAIGVPRGAEGPDLESLERVVLRERPRFFYLMPAFHNPTGLCASPRNRRGLLELARRHRLLLLEDDLYHRLAFGRPAPPPLRADEGDGLVCYVDGFSKAGLPGVRVGYMIVPPALRGALLAARRADDLCGAAALQRALADFLRRGLLERSLAAALRQYRARRDALMQSLERSMPEGIAWTRPEGGFSTWLTLPPGADGGAIGREALARGLAVTPGELFFSTPPSRAHMRLCFSRVTEAEIRRGAALLGAVLKSRAPAPGTALLRDWSPLV